MKFKFNIPNKITLIRVALIPLFAFILLADIPYKDILAAFIFAMLSISDFLDGYFARKKKQVTELGKLIDPIADKLLISTALIFLIGRGVELWMAITIIAREVIVTAVRIYLLPQKLVVPASSFGKAKTVVQSIAIVFILLKLPFSWHLMLVAVVLTLVSGIEYLIRIKKLTGNKIVNFPNLITLIRFLLILPFVYYFLDSKLFLSLVTFSLIAISDKLDGISARVMNQKTELGSAFDSFTDWTLIITALFLLILKGKIDFLWVLAIGVPSLISGMMKMIYAKRLKNVPVTIAARVSVALIYIAMAFILISLEYNLNFIYTIHLLAASAITVWIAMAAYVIKVLSMPTPK